MQIFFIFLAIFFPIFVAIRPFKIGKFELNIATSSILSLIFLIAVQVIDISIIRAAIVGSGNLNPWQIIIIFFTVAYVSISLDVTGILDYISYHIAQKTQGSLVKLFLFFYLLACVLTIFTSNDIVILTLTPIIFYLSKHADLNITPLLFAEFFGANIMSTLLYIGNPTNIIIGDALNLSFLGYTEVMWLPTLVAAFVNIILLYVIFRSSITQKFKLNSEYNKLIQSYPNATISSVLILCMLISLSASSYITVDIWEITSIFLVLFAIKDILFYIYEKSILRTYKKEVNYFYVTLKRMPWRILPFILSFFIFVEGLNYYGFIDKVAQLISTFSTSLLSGIAINGFVGLVLSNLINNQPATIFLSYVLTSDSFEASKEILRGSAYAINISTSIAANITLVGALAGLMWQNILKDKGIKISYVDFLKKGLLVTPIVFLASLISLYFVLVPA